MRSILGLAMTEAVDALTFKHAVNVDINGRTTIIIMEKEEEVVVVVVYGSTL